MKSKFTIPGYPLIAILMILTAGLVLFYPKKDSLSKYDIHSQQLELEYWKTKALIVQEIEKFMSKVPYHNVAPLLVLKYADKYDIDPRLFLVQGYLESHYGTKGLATKTHSVCNVGAWDDGTITATYKHPNESIEPYYKLISRRYLVNKTIEELLKKFVDKDGNRYASYLYYEDELRTLWNRVNNETQLDSLLSIYQYYKLELNR